MPTLDPELEAKAARMWREDRIRRLSEMGALPNYELAFAPVTWHIIDEETRNRWREIARQEPTDANT